MPCSIQPHGVLIVLAATTFTVTHVSANIEPLLGISAAAACGAGLNAIFGVALGSRLEAGVRQGELVAANPLRFEWDAGGTPLRFECVAHRSATSVILELEVLCVDDGGAQVDSYAQMSMLLARMERTLEITELVSLSAATVQKITGFDRAMVYRFDPAFNGEVIAEVTSEKLSAAFLGLHFPADDLPEQAPRLSPKSVLRIIPDVGSVPVPLIVAPALSVECVVDLSPAMLRGVSPVHREYLRNLGVGASMSISIVIRRRLWGLIMCHHRKPYRIDYAKRALCMLLADVLALQLASRMEARTFEAKVRTSALVGSHSRNLAAYDDIGVGLIAAAHDLFDLFCAQGVVVRHAGTFRCAGSVPDERGVGQIAAELFRMADNGVASTDRLADFVAPASLGANLPGGALLLALSGSCDEYVLCFRQETIQVVEWSGVVRAAAMDENGAPGPRTPLRLTKETIRGRSLPWSEHDADTARVVRQRIIERAHALDRRRADERIRYLADHDPLTQLPNRATFNTALSEAMRDGALLAVLFFDIDRFKRLNDTFGQAVGDRVLQAVAERLRRCVRPEDTVARFGADQFVVLTAPLATETDVQTVANAILTAISEPLIVANAQELRFTASMGVAVYPVDGQDAETLVRHADAAMLRSKELVHNRLGRFGETQDRAASEVIALQRRMQRGLERGEFVPYYQPIVDIRSGRLKSMEALARWISPDRGILPPSQFIAFAEKSHLIVSLGAAMLRAACGHAALWRINGNPEAASVSVNVSARQFADTRFLPTVNEALAATGLAPEALQIEITESLLIGDEAYAIATLRALAKNGVRIAIDDFGTGYSSLGYLKRLPVHILKIDQTFVRDITTLPDDAAIVRAIIAMAHSLNLLVIAEGVQSNDQLEFLRAEGCDAVQGHLTGPPLKHADALSYVERFECMFLASSPDQAGH